MTHYISLLQRRKGAGARLSFACMIALLMAVTFVSTPHVHASGNTYYVATNGIDSNTGTSTGSAFQHIQKCASIMVAGDTCLVRAGTYHETITPATSGTSANLITYQPYNGESVTIDGADAVTGWSNYSGNIYRANVTLPVNGYNDTGFLANQIFVDGQMMNQARWPNTGLDQLHPTEATAGSGTSCGSSSTIYDSSLPSGNWVGATIHLRGGFNWTAQVGTVTAYSAGSSVTFSGGGSDCSNLGAKQGSQYYLTNGPLSSLDTANEWYYDGSAHQLYLWTGSGDNPTSHTVEAKQRTNAFDLSGRSYTQINGFHLFASTITTSSTSSNIVIDGINAQYLSHFVTTPNNPNDTSGCGIYCTHSTDSGIILQGSNHILRNSTLAYSAGNGVGLIGNNNTVTNNLIHDMDYSATYNAPIRIEGTGETITYNTLYNSGRDGINGGSSNETISHNDIHHFGMLNQDLGGFYTCCSTISGSGSSIDHNWIHDNQATSSRSFTGAYTGSGIYIDNGAHDFLVHHNVTWNNVGDGIRLNGYTVNTSINNLVYNNTMGGGQNHSFTLGGVGDCSGSQYINNIFTGSADSCSQATISHNLNSGTDPLFVDATNHNYHLQSTSPAKDAGQVISGITDGYAGSAPDIGAYEYSGTDWTAGCNFSGSTNRVGNPGFEDGSLSSWSSYGTASVSNSSARSGSYAAQIGGTVSGIEQVVSGLISNTTYTLTGWGKVAVAGEQVWIGVKLYGGTEKYQIITSTSYTQAALTFTTGASNTSAKIYLYKASGSGNAYGDDFALVFSDNVNFVGNPGFESGSLSSWCNVAGITYCANASITSDPLSGNYAAQVGGAGSDLEQVINGLSPNTTYTLTAWGKVAVAGDQLYIGVKDFGGTETSQIVTVTSYTQAIVTFTTGASSTSAKIYLYKGSGSGNGYGDDYSVVKMV